MRSSDEVEIQSIVGAVVLLDRWIAYARELEAQCERLRVRLRDAGEDLEALHTLAKNYEAIARYWERVASVPF